MDRGAWWATVHRVAKSRTRLNDSTSMLNEEPLPQNLSMPLKSVIMALSGKLFVDDGF